MNLEVCLKKSKIGFNKKIRDNLRSLKLKKINQKVVISSEDVCSMGRLRKIRHMVEVKEVI